VGRAEVLPTEWRAVHGALWGVTERLVDTTETKRVVASRGGYWFYKWISANVENGAQAYACGNIPADTANLGTARQYMVYGSN
jgi:hypothetical protein